MTTSAKARISRRAVRRSGGNATSRGHGATAPAIDRRDEAGSVLILALIFLVSVSGLMAALADWSGNALKNTITFTGSRSLQYAAAGATNVAIWGVRYTAPTTLTMSISPGAVTSLDVTALPAGIPAGGSVTIGSGATAQTVALSAQAAIGATTISVNFTSTFAEPSGTVVTGFGCPGTSLNGSVAGQAIATSGDSIAVWCSTIQNPGLPPPNNFMTREVTISACSDTQSEAACMQGPLVQAIIYLDDYSDFTGSTPGTFECNSSDQSTCGTGMTVNSWVIK